MEIEERARIAAIVDPLAWTRRQQLLDRAEHWSANPDGFRQEHAFQFRDGCLKAADDAVRDSLRKSDAIIAALAPEPAGGERDNDDLLAQLRGRARFLRDYGGVKSPDLMEEAAAEIEHRRRAEQEAERRVAELESVLDDLLKHSWP